MKIEVQDVRLKFSDFNLKVSGWKLAAGEHLLIEGPSGSGKTTFLHMLAGLLIPDSGLIKIGDLTLNELPAQARAAFRKENCGIIFQKIHLLPHLTLLENVFMGVGHAHETKSDLYALLDVLKLDHREDHLPENLSLGEAQRAAVARALASEPKIIFADEPTSGLDDANAEIVMRLLTSSMKSKTLIIVSHDHRIRAHIQKSVNFMEIAKS